MADTHRVEFTAREVRNIFVQLKNESYKNQPPENMLKLARVMLVGHQFGAHIASIASKYLRRKYEDVYTHSIGIGQYQSVNVIL